MGFQCDFSFVAFILAPTVGDSIKKNGIKRQRSYSNHSASSKSPKASSRKSNGILTFLFQCVMDQNMNYSNVTMFHLM